MKLSLVGIGATLLALGFALSSSPAWAQTPALTLNISPDTDYRAFCSTRTRPVLSFDWTKWDGKAPTVTFERMFSDASIYLRGDGQTLRNRSLARSMLDYLSKSSWVRKGDALYQLGNLYLDGRGGFYDPSAAIVLLQQAGSMGNSSAATLLGKTYLEGEDVTRDEASAEHFLKLGAAANDIEATLALAKLYYSQREKPDTAAGDNYLKLGLTSIYRNIANGDCSELNFLGDIFADNDLKVYDPAAALAWYEAAYDTGDADAASELVSYYGDAKNPLFDRNKTIALLEFAANAGRISAMVDLADRLLKERSPASLDKARTWLNRAADNGEMAAFETLVDIEQGVFGGTPDAAKAYGYLNHAASLDNASARIELKLAKALELGEGTPVDRLAAYAHYKRAASLGAVSAYTSLYDLAAGGITVSGDKPIEFLLAGAQAGQADAMARLSDVYFCGADAERDPQTARQWQERAAAAGDSPTLILLADNALKTSNDQAAYFSNIEKAARLGDPKAMILLSNAYMQGVGIAVDPAKAAEWKNKSLADPATKAQALLALGQIARDGDTANPPDGALAEKFLLQASDLGNVSALYELGDFYSKDHGTVRADAKKSMQYLLSAAQKGHVAAMFRLARLGISKEEGAGKDWNEWLGLAAAQGSVRATLMQGSLSSDSAVRRTLFDQVLARSLCDPDDIVNTAATISSDSQYVTAAMVLVKRAIAIGSDDPNVLYGLGELVKDGLAGPDLVQSSLSYFQRAADAGKVEAMRELGKAYFRSAGVQQDIAMAKKWLLLASRAGDRGAMKELGDLVVQMGPTDPGLDDIISALKDGSSANLNDAAVVLAEVLSEAAKVDDRYRTEADEWLRKAAQMGDGKSMLVLSNIYALGIGVAKSDQQSAQWLKAAAEVGYRDAYPKYAMVLELGLGTERDPEQARYWLNKASISQVKQ